jgi:hypothetical protein
MFVVGHCTCPASSSKMFEHLMISVKIILCLESHETLIELSVHTSTHTHTHYKNIIYIYIYIYTVEATYYDHFGTRAF